MTREEQAQYIFEKLMENPEFRKAFVGAITDAVDEVVKVIEALEHETCDDMGEVSDGYHTFNQLYHQRAVLFATIVNQNKDKSWKSFKHSDGNYCFDSNGEWFIVGIDTPQGSYTYHYAKEYWDMFDCQKLECGKEWDGHTEEDVTRLLSLQKEPCADAISRQAVLDMLEDINAETEGVGFYYKHYVEYIKKLPPVTPTEKQEPCEDCVSRQAVLDALDKSKYSNEFCEEHHIDWSINLGMAHIVVNELKPVTPQYTEAEIQKMQDLESAEIQKAYEIGKEEGSDVLDKIRAEIMDINVVRDEYSQRQNDYCDGVEFAKRYVLQIIDKYKSESEE